VAVLDLIFQNPHPRINSVPQVKGDLLYRLIGEREQSAAANGKDASGGGETSKAKKKKHKAATEAAKEE
jgi:hypothetical protein